MIETSSTRRTLILVLVVLQSALAPIVVSGLIPNYMDHLTRTFHATRGDIGAVLALMVLFSAAFGLLAGLLAERIGNERVLLVAIAGQALTIGLFTFVDARWAAVLLAFLFYSTKNMTAVANALSTDFFTHSQNRGVNLLHAVNAVGKLIGPLVALAFALAWRWSFFATGIFGLLILASAFFAFRGPVHHVRSNGLRPEPILHRPFFWLLINGFTLLVAAELSVTVWLPTFLMKVRSFSGDTAKLLHACFMAGLVSAHFATVLVGYRLRHRHIISVCLACTLFLFPALFLRHPLLIAACLFFHGASFSATYPTYFSYITRFFPTHVSALSGGSALTTSLGYAVAYFVSGWISDFSPTWAVLIGPVCMAAFAVLFVALLRHESRTLSAVPCAGG